MPRGCLTKDMGDDGDVRHPYTHKIQHAVSIVYHLEPVPQIGAQKWTLEPGSCFCQALDIPKCLEMHLEVCLEYYIL